jgi:hypothetical protein
MKKGDWLNHIEEELGFMRARGLWSVTRTAWRSVAHANGAFCMPN